MARTITSLPTGAAASTAVVAADNAAGTETQRVTLGDIAALSASVVATPTGLGSTVNVTGYAPGSGDIYRLSASTGVNLWGLGITGVDGTAKLFINVGTTGAITLNHATGPLGNAQFAVPWQGNYVMDTRGGAALLVYDSTSSVWRVV